jgi:hypothetical protein
MHMQQQRQQQQPQMQPMQQQHLQQHQQPPLPMHATMSSSALAPPTLHPAVTSSATGVSLGVAPLLGAARSGPLLLPPSMPPMPSSGYPLYKAMQMAAPLYGSPMGGGMGGGMPGPHGALSYSGCVFPPAGASYGGPPLGPPLGPLGVGPPFGPSPGGPFGSPAPPFGAPALGLHFVCAARPVRPHASGNPAAKATEAGGGAMGHSASLAKGGQGSGLKQEPSAGALSGLGAKGSGGVVGRATQGHGPASATSHTSATGSDSDGLPTSSSLSGGTDSDDGSSHSSDLRDASGPCPQARQ